MKPLGWVLIPSVLCPYKMRKFGQRETPGHVSAQQEESSLQAKERGFRRNQTRQQLDLGLPANRTMRNKFLLVKPLSAVFCYGNPSKPKPMSIV